MKKFTYTFLVFQVTLFLAVGLSCSKAYGQLIINQEGEFILGYDYFNPAEIRNRKIETVTVTFSDKKPLKPIKKKRGVSQNYLFDSQGRIARYYSTSETNFNTGDTLVEWRFYKKNLLETIKKTDGNEISVTTLFYEGGLPTVEIFGKSESASHSKTEMNITSYKEQYAQYVAHITLKNGDSVIHKKATGGKIIEKTTYSFPDSNTKKIEFEFPFSPYHNKSQTITYEGGLVAKLTTKKTNEPEYEYVFGYDSQQKITYFTKLNLNTNSTESFSELLYDEDTQNLQAIITKNYQTEEVSITKYTYTFYQ